MLGFMSTASLFRALRFGAAGVCLLGAAAFADAAPESPEARVPPEVRNLEYATTFPYRQSDSPIKSHVKFNLVYGKQATDENRAHAYREALEAVQLYLQSLEDTEVITRGDADNLFQEATITETRGGKAGGGGVHSVAHAAEQARQSRSYHILLRKVAVQYVDQSDGTVRENLKTVDKVEQTIKIEGDAKNALIEVHCKNDDALQLADELFSVE